jgi:hypothetical protein
VGKRRKRRVRRPPLTRYELYAFLAFGFFRRQQAEDGQSVLVLPPKSPDASKVTDLLMKAFGGRTIPRASRVERQRFERDEAIREFVDQNPGSSYAEAAEHFGCSLATVKRACATAGVSQSDQRAWVRGMEASLNAPKGVKLTERLGVPETTLNDWRLRKKGPPFVKVQRLVRYPAALLEQWLADRLSGAA